MNKNSLISFQKEAQRTKPIDTILKMCRWKENQMTKRIIAK